MACLPRYAEALDYATIFLCEHLDAGLTTISPVATTLTDSGADFSRMQVTVGMPVYNATKRTYGKVTSVATTALGTTIAWSTGDVYQIAAIGQDAVATIEAFLAIAAGDINAARSSVGGCA